MIRFMKSKMAKKPELLAPAQDWNSLKVVSGLADAIYFGVQNYNMRAKANNFKQAELEDVAEYCHAQEPRIKTYLCTNILIYDPEINELENLIARAKDAKIDAIIAHDLATIQIARRHDMAFHVSTQANISNIEAARFYEEMGAERIILARELSLKQIARIKKQLERAQIECFVHGSMCTAISGRCYFSASIHESEEHSANRGNCAQPCRRRWVVVDDQNNEFIYDGQLFLNAKDLCMIEYIPELIEAKIDALKIEGRMKDPLYVKTVTKCYREAIDDYFNGTYTKDKVIDWIKRLSLVYNRGFHTGFYFKKPTINDIQLESRGNLSPYKKTYFGKILSHDEKSKSANVLIESKERFLRLGDEIIIIGKNTYQIETVKKIVFKGEKIEKIKRDRNSKSIEFNLPLLNRVETEDKIYLITKE
ncbi:MAG: U32 family peptidase [Promethearchaeota archaeon]|nr:MAG: U32 family peptidase [Candidatus Lokiarchaeota archaeon]